MIFIYAVLEGFMLFLKVQGHIRKIISEKNCLIIFKFHYYQRIQSCEQSEEAGGGHTHRKTIPYLFSTSVMVYFMYRQKYGTNALESAPTDGEVS